MISRLLTPLQPFESTGHTYAVKSTQKDKIERGMTFNDCGGTNCAHCYHLHDQLALTKSNKKSYLYHNKILKLFAYKSYLFVNAEIDALLAIHIFKVGIITTVLCKHGAKLSLMFATTKQCPSHIGAKNYNKTVSKNLININTQGNYNT